MNLCCTSQRCHDENQAASDLRSLSLSSDYESVLHA